MAYYTGAAGWFCCYPDACGCDACCCRGSNCQAGCTSNKCGRGACCACNSSSWGYAWKNHCSGCCNANLYPDIPCGATAGLSKDGGVTIYRAPRVDTGPGTCRMIDLTKAMFSQFAPLSQGIITGFTAIYPCCVS